MDRKALDLSRCAELLGALAAPERLGIVSLLRDGPANVTEIAAVLRTPRVNVSHHLNVLRHAGLIRNEKRGRFVVYSLSPGVLQTTGNGATHDHIDLGGWWLALPPRPAAAP